MRGQIGDKNITYMELNERKISRITKIKLERHLFSN
jgi:hypothetical protein